MYFALIKKIFKIFRVIELVIHKTATFGRKSIFHKVGIM